MTRKKKQDKIQKTGKLEIPISNGYQMNMAHEFKDRQEQDVEVAKELSQDTESREYSSERKNYNSNESKPNFQPRKSKKKS